MKNKVKKLKNKKSKVNARARIDTIKEHQEKTQLSRKKEGEGTREAFADGVTLSRKGR